MENFRQEIPKNQEGEIKKEGGEEVMKEGGGMEKEKVIKKEGAGIHSFILRAIEGEEVGVPTEKLTNIEREILRTYEGTIFKLEEGEKVIKLKPLSLFEKGKKTSLYETIKELNKKGRVEIPAEGVSTETLNELFRAGISAGWKKRGDTSTLILKFEPWRIIMDLVSEGKIEMGEEEEIGGEE